jgi:hypothetical protein
LLRDYGCMPTDLARLPPGTNRAAAFTEPASAVGWRDLPTWYLVSEHDNAIPPDCERFMAQRMNAVTESVDGSHAAFIAQPKSRPV